MSDKSAIEWTDATWNPVTGCSKVSPGCAHCYAETLALTRLTGKAGYPGLPWTPANAAENVVLRPGRLTLPLRWRQPRRVFVNSMSDLFHERVPDSFIDRVFAVMAIAGRHTFQVLTKRPERMRAYVTDPATPTRIGEATREFARPGRGPEASFGAHIFDEDHIRAQGHRWREPGFTWRVCWPVRNVWLGTSVENQRWANERIPHLLATTATVRFLSMEPLLGPVELSDLTGRADAATRLGRPALEGIDWVIVGGESGPGFRPVDPEWVRSIRDQAGAADVPFLFKQWGGIRSKSGGRELDGRTWDAYPEAVP